MKSDADNEFLLQQNEQFRWQFRHIVIILGLCCVILIILATILVTYLLYKHAKCVGGSGKDEESMDGDNLSDSIDKDEMDNSINNNNNNRDKKDKTTPLHNNKKNNNSDINVDLENNESVNSNASYGGAETSLGKHHSSTLSSEFETVGCHGHKGGTRYTNSNRLTKDIRHQNCHKNSNSSLSSVGNKKISK